MPKISNVYQDKKTGKWFFVANLGYDINGNRKRYYKRGFDTQKQAKNAYDEYMHNHSKTAVNINSTMYYKEFFEKYFIDDYKSSVKISTFENRKSTMYKHFPYFYGTKLKDINPPMIKRWQNDLYKSGYSNSYIRNVFGLFQITLDLAVKLELINDNVAKKVGNVKKVKQKVDFWTIEEFKKVMSTFDISEYYGLHSFVIIWVLFMSGVRFGEAEALLWQDIDFKEKTVIINKSMFYKNAEEFYVSEPKTKASNRVIALDDDTIKYLEQWKKLQQKNIVSEYVFSYNGLPITKSTVRNIIIQHSKLADVHKITIHALRHSHASMLISLGESALVIRDRLGHEDIETTLGTYGHLYPNTNRDVANKLSNLITVEQDDTIKRKLVSNQYVKRGD